MTSAVVGQPGASPGSYAPAPAGSYAPAPAGSYAAPPPGYAAPPPAGYGQPGYPAPPPQQHQLAPSLNSVFGAQPSGPLRPWSSGCMACFSDCSICCMGCWCPCILFGNNVVEIRGQGGCCEPCCIWCCIGEFLGFPCVYSGPMRTEMRIKYGLQEDPMHDCIMHLPWCVGCALCQEARELKAIREGKVKV